MARLRKKEYKRFSAPEASEDDAAAHQLRTEYEASQTPRAPAPQSSAARGASYLNAARTQRPSMPTRINPSSPPTASSRTLALHSSPGRLPIRGEKPGKLKRPSFLANDMAKRERLPPRNIYELPASPKNVSRHTVPQNIEGATLGKTSGTKGHDGQPFHSHPSNPRHQTNEPLSNQILHCKSARQAGENVDVAVIDWEKLPEENPPITLRSKRKADTHPTAHTRVSKSPRKEDHEPIDKSRAQEYQPDGRRMRSQIKNTNPQVLIHRKTLPQRRVASLNANPKTGPKLSSQEIEAHPHGDRVIPESEEDETNTTANGQINGNSTTASHQERIGTEQNDEPRKHRGRPRKADNTTALQARSTSAGRTEPAAQPNIASRGQDVYSLPKPQSGSSGSSRSKLQPTTVVNGARMLQGEDEWVQPPQDEDSEEESSSKQGGSEFLEEEDAKRADSYEIEGLFQVFNFLDSGRRHGKCQTNQAQSIRRACRQASVILDEDHTSSQGITDILHSLQGMLMVVQDIDEDERYDFKADAYYRVFYSLIRLLKHVYERMAEMYETVMCIPALRIITSLVSSILSFKDTIASWKVGLVQRFKGDRPVRDVDQKLIAPLRVAHKDCGAHLWRLQQKEQIQKQSAEMEDRRRERETAEKLKAEAEILQIKKQNLWHDLYAYRTAAEPNMKRWASLRWVPLHVLEERDANGIQFERLPLFRDRVAPPAYRNPNLKLDEWTDEQVSALIDGLRKYAGPDVEKMYWNIFQAYCNPEREGRGILRDFGVPEITAQATDIKTRLMDADQSSGRITEKWVNQIPILP
ncbi:hypothetical protein CC78DRAFT_622247 [Lojkania enalia]|uniref:Uncharacterized protein n=1 Tax=Lojkania enalia TaxID=147567 RepID=A0A9P4JWV8_9PLEO|nr:hypothetical protein CC78DRAFT_622247 [Didymosphaeria enalia]